VTTATETRWFPYVYFGQMDGKQHQEDFANINTTWSHLDCVIYTSTVEAGISLRFLIVLIQL